VRRPQTERKAAALRWLALAGVVALVGSWLIATLDLAHVQPDVAEYQAYAVAFWQHHVLPLEYPPLAVLAIAIPGTPPLGAYPIAFGAWMCVFGAAVYLLVRRGGGSSAGVALLAYLVAGAFATVLQRFDIVAALTVVGAYLLLRERRYRACYLLLAVGTLIKLFPLFLLPLVFIEHYRSTSSVARGDRVVAVGIGVSLYLAVVMAGFMLAAIVDSSHVLGSLTYAYSRPLEVESGPATLLWLASLAGLPVHGAFSYGSFNLLGAPDRWLGTLGGFVMLVCWGYTCIRLWRGRIDADRAWIAVLCIVMLTGKVFSAQYLIWIIPLVALIEGLDLVWLLIALLTTLIFPILFDHVDVRGTGLLIYPWPMLAAIAARNILLLVATLRELGLVRWERFRVHQDSWAAKWPRPIESSPVPR
jgi:Glycosyltransferase family 87